jgi:hypothetical protein
MKLPRMKLLAFCASAALLLAACGGGGGGAQTSNTPPVLAASQLVGTAATGAALSYAPVAITNSSGVSPCEEATITTSGVGSYTCTLKAGETAPFFVVVTDPTGNTAPLVSIATTTPAAGSALTVNATPLTTAIVAQLAADGNALTVVSSRTVDAAALQAVTANVVAQLQPVLTSIGAPAGYDPFTTSITAATSENTGNTADQVLDIVKVATDPTTQTMTLSTVDNPTPVALATASSAGGTVAAPNPSVSSLSQGAQVVAQQFSACFAVPTSSRVLSKTDTIPASQGGPEVDTLDAACDNLPVADSDNAANLNFLQNGYSSGQLFYGMLTNDKMTGAKFSVPEIIAFYPKEAGAVAPALNAYDRAILNLRYVDNAGNPGNLTTVTALLPGTSSSALPTEWWLVGNQQPVDVTVRAFIRRQQQMNPNNTGNGSYFQTGIYFGVNRKGPGSVNGTDNLAMARISGPGLPGDGAAGTGLVYKVSSQASQATMDLVNKTGNLTTGSLCGNDGATFNCPNFWLSRTQGVTGTAATTLVSPPTGATNLLIWAQSGDGVDSSKFVKGASYKVELFYGTSTTPLHTFHKTLLSDLVPATSAVNLPWNTPGPQTLAALDPAGALTGAQSALSVDWVQNISAQQIGTVSAVVNNSGSYGPTKSVPTGATSLVLDNVTVPAFGTPGTMRTIQTGYRMTDGSYKSAIYVYN